MTALEICRLQYRRSDLNPETGIAVVPCTVRTKKLRRPQREGPFVKILILSRTKALCSPLAFISNSFTQALQAVTLNALREVHSQSLLGVITPQTKYINQFNADFHLIP